MVLRFSLLAAVIILSLLPARVVPRQLSEGTVGHFAAYLALAFIPAVAMRRLSRAFEAVITVACLGLLIEVLQVGIPGRAFEWTDVLMNLVGGIAGGLSGAALRFWVTACQAAADSNRLPEM